MNKVLKHLRLSIELVPSSCWYNNLRNIISDEDWDKIRKKAYASTNYKCAICGCEERLNCHEIWEYDDKEYTQRLKGFIAICDMCHHVKHIGLAGIKSSKGELDYKEVVNHFIRVNNCDRNIFKKHRKEAFEQWRKRSNYNWKTDFGEYKNMIKDNQKDFPEKHPINPKSYIKLKHSSNFPKSNLNCDEMIKLKDAFNLYKQEERTPANSYDWYRKSAKNMGRILIGRIDVPTYKENGIWFVDRKKFYEAIKKHQEDIKQLKQFTKDYDKGIIHGKDGDVVYTEWGGYRIYGSFRYVWSDYQRARNKSDGTWYCNICNISAKTEHNKKECHLCNDWNGCGKDCTLSKVYCIKCCKSIDI